MDVGCVLCPIGKYKSSVADVECSACPTGNGGAVQLTTLEEGELLPRSDWSIDKYHPQKYVVSDVT